MSFTPDELQAFNDILDKKLSTHRREMERVFDQRLHTLRHELEQRLNTTQQVLLHAMAQKLGDQQKGIQATLHQKLNAQHIAIMQAVSQEVKQRQQQQQPQLAGLVDRALAAQLLAIEELLNQHLAAPSNEDAALPMGAYPPNFAAIEVQTELPWEDLIDIFGKALDERFVILNESIQSTMRNVEQYFAAQLRNLQTQFQDSLFRSQPPPAYSGNLSSMQEVFQSIEQLERIIESMQVAMTANYALLSNRLYHHQQLPIERVHNNSTPTSSAHLSPPNGTNANSPLSLNSERGGQ